MEQLTPQAISELLKIKADGPALTMYVPTHKAGTPPNMTEDQIRLKNLAHKADLQLAQRKDGQLLRDRLSAEIERIYQNREFWEAQTQGLLMCGQGAELRMFHLPIDTEEYLAVNSRFHLAPIFGLLNDMTEYYVLALGQHQPVLYRGNNFTLQPADIDLPESMEAALNIDEANQGSEQQRSSEGSGSYNGRGGAKDPLEADRQKFWRLIDQRITDSVKPALPLLLAGVDSDIAEYRAVAHYPKLLPDAVGGNFTAVKPGELLKRAMEAVKRDIILPLQRAAVEEYRRAKGQAPGQAAKELSAIADAAENGRVDTLLLGGIRYTADTVSDDVAPVPVLSFPSADKAEAVQDIAYQVWNTRGHVVNIEPAEMPEPGALALATLRY